jgi:hypothetical protein
MTYGQICDVYVQYVLKSPSSTVVVFGGYHDYSTKDEAHLRRKGNKVSVPMVGDEKLIDVQKKPFLANEINKQRFINFLGEKLMDVDHVEANADVLIVNVALEQARKNMVILEGTDTDLPVLLLY